MRRIQDIYNKRVYVMKKARRKRGDKGKDAKAQGSNVPEERLAKLGRVHSAVFSSDGSRVVGILVKRPDVAGMVKRDDVFVALDSIDAIEEGFQIRKGDATCDDAARKRLGLDWDRCVLWNGMDAKTRSGKVIGYVNDVSFDEKTGEAHTFYVGDGGISQSLVGSFEVPARMVLGYSKGYMIVSDEASKLELNGGAAARAGVGYAKAKLEGQKAAKKAETATAEAVDKGSFALGRGLGKAKRAIEEAMADDEETDKQQPSAPPTPATNVEISAPEIAGELHRPAGDSPAPTTYVPVKKQAVKKQVPAGGRSQGAAGNKGGKKTATQKPKSKEDKANEAARKIGKQIGKTRGMWGSFMDEFNKASK